MKKNNWLPLVPWIMGGLITLVIGLYFRLYPLAHNVAADSYESATMLVLAKVRASITEQIARRYPDMPPAQRQRIIQEQFNQVVRTQNAKLRDTFDKVGLQLLQKTGETRHYLQESDSYYFLDLTQNILEQGDVSSKVNGSQYFNNKMLAPLGYWEPQTWHPYIGAWVYKAARFLDPSIDVMRGVAFTPLVLFPFVLAAFLLACRALGCQWPAAFTASIFFTLAPIYLQRSTYAWYDNDSYSVLFPALNLGLTAFALRSLDNTRKTIIWSLLAGLSFALFARFWTGWSFSWGITMAALALMTTRAFIFKEPRRANLALILLITGAMALGCLTIMIGINQFLALIPLACAELGKFIAPRIKDWPDLFIVVGELRHGTTAESIMLTGGPIVFWGAAAAFFMYGRDAVIKRKSPPDHILLLALFTAVTFVLALSAERFALLLVTPLALAFALGLEQLWQARPSWAVRLKLPVSTSTGGLIAAFLVVSVIPIAATNRNIASFLHPIFNSAWDRALTALHDKTPANSVIDTWWAPGHFVKAIARREVTFDGASIKGEQAYWLTRIYLSRSEQEALGFLRMLNTSSNQACEFLQGLGWPLSRAVPLLEQITPLSRAQAARYLNGILGPAHADALLKLTHAAPPPSYLLIYNEIVEGNVLLGYVGKWDFARIEHLNADPAQLKKIPSRSSRGYIDFLWSLVGGQLRQSETLSPAGRNGSRILFDQGVMLDTAEMSVVVNSPKFGHGIPAAVVYLDEASGHVVEKPLTNATLGYAAVIFRDQQNTPHCILMDQMLAGAIIMKLYYFDGKGLDYFKPFAKEQDLTGRTKIFVYKVKWPASF